MQSACTEMWNAAAFAFALGPLLTVGAAVYIALNISLSRLAVWVQRRSSFARRAPARVVGTPPIP